MPKGKGGHVGKKKKHYPIVPIVGGTVEAATLLTARDEMGMSPLSYMERGDWSGAGHALLYNIEQVGNWTPLAVTVVAEVAGRALAGKVAITSAVSLF